MDPNIRDAAWSGTAHGADHTMAIARAVASCAQPGDIIALWGPLGAGKTQFVRGLAMGLGIDAAQVTSPTFVLVHEYEHPMDGPHLVHIDGYRIFGPGDLESIGWETGGGELARGAVVAIEWADRLGDELGGYYLGVELAHESPDRRHIAITPCGGWLDRTEALLAALNGCDDGRSPNR